METKKEKASKIFYSEFGITVNITRVTGHKNPIRKQTEKIIGLITQLEYL